MRQTGLFASLVAILVLAGVSTAVAQRRGGFGGGGNRGPRFGGGSGAPILPNIPYDGKYTFIRLRYGPPIPYQTQRVAWSHDYPEGEVHFTKILNEISLLGPHMEQSNVMALDDPDLFKYPICAGSGTPAMPRCSARCRTRMAIAPSAGSSPTCTSRT